jgi:hypothetical protein
MFDFQQLVDLETTVEIVVNARHSINRDGHHQFGLPLPEKVLLQTRFQWHSTGVKTKPAAMNRRGNVVSVLLNAAAARLEAEAERLKEKAAKLRYHANQANHF